MAAVIDVHELRRRTEANEDLVLVDVLPPSLYLVGHLPGSVNIPVRELEDGMAVLPRDRPIVIYCSGPDSPLSRTAAETLEQHGFTNVVHYVAGIEAWEAAGYPVEETL